MLSEWTLGDPCVSHNQTESRLSHSSVPGCLHVADNNWSSLPSRMQLPSESLCYPLLQHICIVILISALFPPPPPPPPTSLKHKIYGLTSGFTRLIMKIKYVCHGLISLHVNFHDNRTKWTLTSNIKICRWGGKEKEPLFHSHYTKCLMHS